MNRILSALLIIIAILYISCLEDIPVRNNPYDPDGENFQGWRAPTLSAPSKRMNYNLSWTDTNAGSYLIEEAKKSDFTDATSYPVNGLMHSFSHDDEGSVYYYRVRTNTGNKDSGWSNVVSVEVSLYSWKELGITYVSIPSGSFIYSAVEITLPVHSVTVSSFEMGAYEITQGQYKAVMGINPSYYTGNDNLPVERVRWWDAIKFCNALSAKAGLDKCYNESTGACDFTKNGTRLPTEAEWEYACRAGTTTTYNLGNNESDLDRAGWYSSNSSSKTHPVGQKTPNAWWLYDMHGNVWECCNDWYGSYSGGSVTNPTGAQTGSYRVNRGGSYYRDAGYCRSANRSYCNTGIRYIDLGFRVVRRPDRVTY